MSHLPYAFGQRSHVKSPSTSTIASSASKQTTKICARCHKTVPPQSSLKALGQYFHESCFVCHDCGDVCRPKYFPYEIPETGELVPLCHHDYFRRNNLLCSVCDQPLRGVYYNAFGKLYDEEHFCCHICGVKCNANTCFNFEDNLYCKYHYLKFYSKRCKGCQYPITDQYIEFPRGDEVHRWHPECYGIHKYWHVTVDPPAVGIPALPVIDVDSCDLTELSDTQPTPADLDVWVNTLNATISKTWSTLYRFEEDSAGCISDMFQYLTSSDQTKGLRAVALLVLKIECLFKGLDSLSTVVQREVQNKFPRNLTTKIMVYLQLLRTIAVADAKENALSSLMSVITGIAHFLKMLIRQGLSDALTISKTSLLKFLRELEKVEIEDNPFRYIHVSVHATDLCAGCNKYIQEACIQFQEKRWHFNCFSCSLCSKKISQFEIMDSTLTQQRAVLCPQCSADDPASISGFKLVTKNAQLIYLLKIALVRSRAVMHVNRETQQRSNSIKENISMQESYIRTLNDIKRLRSKRQSIRVNKINARKSQVLDTADLDLEGFNDFDTGLTKSPNTDPTPVVNMFSNTKTLTLDDISRIVAAEQARDLRPNAFTHYRQEENVEETPRKSGRYFSELSPEEQNKLRMISLVLLLNEDMITETQCREFMVKPGSSFWGKLKSAFKSKKVPVFGTSLDALNKKYGINSDQGVGPIKLAVPHMFDELIGSLHQMDMSVEGVFRKNGNIKKLRELSADIDNNQIPDFTKENPVQLSALLKKFLRELPDPLLTFALYDLWIKAQKSDGIMRKRNIALVYCLLPTAHRNVAEVLFSFLSWVASFAHIDDENGSKMDSHNLSTVIAPNILYDRPETEQAVQSTSDDPERIAASYNDTFAQNQGENYFLAIETVDYLIRYNEEMALVPMFMQTLLGFCETISDFESIRIAVSSITIDLSEYRIEEPARKQIQQPELVNTV